VSDNKLNEPSATRLADWIRRRILELTSLTASAGVSYNKSLAKIASDWNKPDGLTVITPDMAEAFITDLPVSKFWGVGPVTAGRMKELGIHTGGDLRSWPLWKLSDTFGKAGPWYYDLCRGIDDRKVESVRIRKSLGKERTFGEDIEDFDKLAEFLENLCSSVWEELEEKNLYGRTVTIKVKYGDFRQVTRSRSFLSAVQNQKLFKQTILELLKETEAGRRPVRLVGASVSSFLREEMEDEVRQLSLDFKTETPDLPAGSKPLREPEALLRTSLSIH
jgi:DNA polymerase-4